MPLTVSVNLWCNVQVECKWAEKSVKSLALEPTSLPLIIYQLIQVS